MNGFSLQKILYLPSGHLLKHSEDLDLNRSEYKTVSDFQDCSSTVAEEQFMESPVY